jgi:CheY-like chemotaxis protein
MSKMHPDLTLLLVEDDVLVRFTVEEILTDAGFGVTTVKNGTDAITALEGDIHRFCTDVQLGEARTVGQSPAEQESYRRPCLSST